jgi:outer membrane biosynthesis protein TonB
MAPASPRSRAWWALGASIALHLTLTQVTGSAARERPASPTGPVSPNAWTGTTFDVDAVLEAPAPEPEQGARSASAPPSEPKAELAAAPQPTKAAVAAIDLKPPSEPSTPASAVTVSGTEPVPAPSPSRDRTHVRHKPRKPARVVHSPAPARDAGSAETQGYSNSAAGMARAVSADGAAPGASYGAEGEARGKAALANAFTHALPLAAKSDSLWVTLPIGHSARVYARLQTDGEGHLVANSSWLEGDAAAPPLELQRLVQRSAALIGTFQFALPKGIGAASQTLRIDLRLKQGSRSDDSLSDPESTTELGWEAPTLGHPGRAVYRMSSGRTLDMRVTLVAK